MSGALHETIKSYDPNLDWGIHHVEITLMQFEYSLTKIMKIDGNCQGMVVLDCAIGNLADELYDEENDNFSITLVSPSGDALLCELDDDEGDAESWLGKMVVGIRIVNVEPSTG